MKRWMRASIAAVVAVVTLVITAAVAVTPGPSMLHDGEAPLADLTGDTVSAKALDLESTLHGVYRGGVPILTMHRARPHARVIRGSRTSPSSKNS